MLFSSEDADILFANIEQLYEFHKIFLQELQDAIVLDKMEISVVGDIFLRNVSCIGWKMFTLLSSALVKNII